MSNWSTFDTQMMSRAIALAEKGRYTTRPNPCVGCVIVYQNKIIGEGYHQRAGQGHAEVNALKMVHDNGLSAEGATAYVTLEPCSHYGRTPPCALGLINAKVARVVVSVTDANPQVSGRGITLLREAGINVDVGLLSEQAYDLNLGFMKRMKTGLPWITVKIAASLDGKTALSNGVSKWITGSAARADVQKYRASHCALITGVETILVDDPSLNVRYEALGELTTRHTKDEIFQPLRVVLDSRARLTATQQLFSIQSPILLVSGCNYPESTKAAFPDHVSFLQLTCDSSGRIPLLALLTYLGQHTNSVLVEAGATLAGAFVAQGLVDDIVLYQAPKLLGSHGRNMLQLPNYSTMEQAPALQLIDERNVGQDKRYILRYNQPY
ncbi:bifunctional diaminohydroxyphosphoribosylaminopyrimidine deaminase/5-amino-6-(5-phosphoribosylamino)uracil reductase RibD [Shewanella sp. BF02_Schw]|jgi:diaminohydroxyphosphoribosylaminopyrimidine deaminase/5-amino-6-(5-phosphoribosylamino)uracil reductase|uniref:bifunctional diaminohydroxyphosphoribosylaminopyrimidine deaminase/5-amino-6-(5-phosphoribosylamino)uracil reductase RibD n=1 Tax=unclassified Shewanella TaxID=196818 RepID=UPI001782347C|nr:bifunctional diaminohydroxyphosphoribosylaminopyrimidine deaminase/5-amino-6-(5-phosphoribosylamino)uracil reductase RibD [Shewanella sp. BF02_Schw]MBO1894571.1 bifunctional diaminohydroxyphosphoribosylaminopyrimidine deaminase/5-amino-6-(5-phosphoribosylamino)uracil reductase RibD [Shewanella sp. BF02_Schw]